MLIHRNGIYMWQGGFKTKDLPKDAGFRWDPATKTWWTKSMDNAVKLSAYADMDCIRHLTEAMALRDKALAASRATDSSFEPPCPKGLSFLGYQKAGVQFALGRRNAWICDEQGLGKTLQAIGVYNADPEIRKVLIVCPAVVKLNWRNEFAKWNTKGAKIGVADGKTWPAAADVVVVNYDVLKQQHSRTTAIEWNLLIFDESHMLKNREEVTNKKTGVKSYKTQRVREAFAIRSKRTLCLSGTPLLNRPEELWTTLQLLDRESWPNFFAFGRKYCNGHQGKWGWDWSGASNLDELNEKLRSTIMIRRMKKDVLAELPPKRRQIIEIPAAGATAQKGWAALASKGVALSEDMDYDTMVQALEGVSVGFEDMSKVRKESAMEKLPAVLAYVKDALEGGEKLIVFCHHRELAKTMAEELAAHKPAVITGETPSEKRQAEVERFQTDPTCRVFVGNIRAAGVGITLTAASHVIFAELDWVPGMIEQAEDRAHRIGQKDHVLIQHLVLEGSIDAMLAKAIVRKQSIAEQTLS